MGGTPAPAANNRLVVVSYKGRSRKFDLDDQGRLSFARVAKVFTVPVKHPDDVDTWTLDDCSLRINKDDQQLPTCSNLRDLFPLPAGSTERPLVLMLEDPDQPEAAGPGPSSCALTPHSREKGAARRGHGTPHAGQAAGSPAHALLSPTRRGAAAAAAAAPPAAQAAQATPARGAAQPGLGACHTPEASPLRGARTPLAAVAPHSARAGMDPMALALAAPPPSQPLALPRPLAHTSHLMKHPTVQGAYFHFPAAQHLPMLMACHLPPGLQCRMRAFAGPAQCAITARAMALYAAASAQQVEYHSDAKLEAALAEARSSNPPKDHYCVFAQQRLTGRKRKPAGSPPPQRTPPAAGGATSASGVVTRGAAAGASGTPGTAAQHGHAGDVDMDMERWTFVGGGTLHCPGGGACRKPGRHENWVLCDAREEAFTYLPVLYDTEQHSTLLIPLTDPRVAGGGTVWFRYEYESKAGRRGQNFWDAGWMQFLEEAVRDVMAG